MLFNDADFYEQFLGCFALFHNYFAEMTTADCTAILFLVLQKLSYEVAMQFSGDFHKPISV